MRTAIPIDRVVHRVAAQAERIAPAAVSMPLLAWNERRSGEPEIHLLPKLARGTEVAVDVGAADGVYSYCLAGLVRECHAFEANPTSAASLRRKLPRVHVHGVALSDRSGTAILRVPVVDGLPLTGWASLQPTNRFEALPSHQVTAVETSTATLDSFGLNGVGFIKIDVEGHELDVLHGAMRLLEKDRPNLLIEAEDRHRPRALPSVYELLRPLGYDVWYLHARRLCPVAWSGRGEIESPPPAGVDRPRNFLLVCRLRLPSLRASGLPI